MLDYMTDTRPCLKMSRELYNELKGLAEKHHRTMTGQLQALLSESK